MYGNDVGGETSKRPISLSLRESNFERPEPLKNDMNGKGTIIAIIGVGVGLAGLILNGQHTTNRAIEKLRAQVNRDFADVRTDITDLRERMARLEGRVDTLVDAFSNRED